jgi:predicted TIM-barrel fold metal-dependent hydrolase
VGRPRPSPGPDLGQVLGEGDVTSLVQVVLDLSVPSDPCGEFVGSCLVWAQVGDRVDGFGVPAPLVAGAGGDRASLANDLNDLNDLNGLSGVRELDPRRDREELAEADLAAAVTGLGAAMTCGDVAAGESGELAAWPGLVGFHRQDPVRTPAAVVAVDPVSPGATGELLDWVTARKAAGLRLVVRTDTDREISDLVARAAELAIPVCVLATAEQLEIVRQLANCFPTIAFVIEHLAAATTMWGIPEESVDALCPLAAQPNVYLKVSTVNLAPIAGASDPIAGLEQLRGLYGASRLMWGSNYRASQGFDYPGMVKLAMRAVRDWSGGDQSFFLGETARTLWPALATRLTQGAEVS